MTTYAIFQIYAEVSKRNVLRMIANTHSGTFTLVTTPLIMPHITQTYRKSKRHLQTLIHSLRQLNKVKVSKTEEEREILPLS